MNEDLAAVGAFLEFLYTGEYYPKRTGERVLENASTTGLDETGDELLKHARVYTLAEKLGMDNLKSLAHSKIHCVNATARGEIAYARYVYANTSKEDVTIRKPVAAFWAQRSHVLRSEAGDEFRDMCLEYPQFGFDVLSKLCSSGSVELLLTYRQHVSWTRRCVGSRANALVHHSVRASGLVTVV